MAHQKNWKMAAQVIRVVDGDTVVLECDLGFRTTTTIKARLHQKDGEVAGRESQRSGISFAIHMDYTDFLTNL